MKDSTIDAALGVTITLLYGGLAMYFALVGQLNVSLLLIVIWFLQEILAKVRRL